MDFLYLMKLLKCQMQFRLLPHYTYDDWLNWEGQWELIEGIPYAMSPMPVPNHQRIAANLLIEFGNSLKKCNDCKVYQPIDYKVADDIIVQPDLLIVCGEISKKYLDFPPVLVVEILSPSTALKDRHSKFEIYQDQKIKYYLIVSPDTHEVEVHEYVTDGYELKQKDKDFKYRFNFTSDCTANIDFKEIW
jgi:Uma2 family endonuclease